MAFDRFIIILPGMSRHYGGRKAGDFLYREDHKAFIYKGTEYPLDQFNAIVPKVIETNRNFVAELPFVKLLEAQAVQAAEPEGPESIFNADHLALLERLHADTLTSADVNLLTERCIASGFPVGPPAPPSPSLQVSPSPSSPPPAGPDSPTPSVSEEGSGKGSSESEAAGSPPAAEDGAASPTPDSSEKPDGAPAPAPPAKKATTKKKTAPKADV